MQMLSIWLSQLSGRWKALGLIIALLTAGFTTGMAASGFTKLPEKVAMLEQRARDWDSQLNELNHNVAAIRRLNQQTLCLTVAEHAHSDWRKCME